MIGSLHSSSRKHMDASIVAQYDFEGSPLSRTGKNNALTVGAVAYAKTPNMGRFGGSSWASISGSNVYFNYPTAVINKNGGSVEFIINVMSYAAGGMNMFRIASTSAARHIEFYYYGGQMYYFSNSAVGYNDPALAISVGSSYYVGVTWDPTYLKVYASTMPNLPSATPIKTYNSPRLDLAASVTSVHMLEYPNADANPIQKFDRVIFSNIVRTKFPTI